MNLYTLLDRLADSYINWRYERKIRALEGFAEFKAIGVDETGIRAVLEGSLIPGLASDAARLMEESKGNFLEFTIMPALRYELKAAIVTVKFKEEGETPGEQCERLQGTIDTIIERFPEAGELITKS